MISFKTESGRFNFRVAGILIQNNKVLIHRLLKDDFYSFPGGRVEMFEDSEAAIIREMKEELNIDIGIVRLLWVAEHFFYYNNDHCHELCFYYLIDCKDDSLTRRSECFTVIEGTHTYEFKWIEIKAAGDEVLYPTFIKSRLERLPDTTEKVLETYNNI